MSEITELGEISYTEESERDPNWWRNFEISNGR